MTRSPHRLAVGWRIPDAWAGGTGSLGQKASRLCSMLSFLAPLLRTWKPGFFLPFPSTRRKDSRGSIIPSHPVHPSYLPWCPHLPGQPHSSRRGRCREPHLLGCPSVRPPVRPTWPWTEHLSKNKIMAVKNKNSNNKTQLVSIL